MTISFFTTHLLCMMLPLIAHAQIDTNLTLHFFKDIQDNTCSYNDSILSMTFGINSKAKPQGAQCFNFAELFGGNISQGAIECSGPAPPAAKLEDLEPVITNWSLVNKESWDPSANYSSVLYRLISPEQDGQKNNVPGYDGSREVSLCPGINCDERDAEGVWRPWYGFNCWSDDQGSCGTMPCTIASFSVIPVYDKPGGKCMTFARVGEKNDAVGVRVSILGALIAALAVRWKGF